MSEPLTEEELAVIEVHRANLRNLKYELEAIRDVYDRRDREILASRADKMSLREIGDEIGMSRQAVLNVINKYAESDLSTSVRAGSGRKNATWKGDE